MTKHENFTDNDWMTIYAYVNEHPVVVVLTGEVIKLCGVRIA
jgi:hypothetical protein